MAVVAGFGGDFAGTGFTGKVTSWEANTGNDAIPVPASFGETTRGTAIGIFKFEGTINGYCLFNAVSTAPHPALPAIGSASSGWSEVASVVLTAAAGCTYTLTANFHDVSLSRPHDGLFEFSCNFAVAANTAVTFAWDESP